MEWRKCPAWPEYEVCECGDVRRIVKRFGNFGLRKPYRASTGYMLIAMRHQGLTRAVGVHQLVAEAFVGPKPSARHEVAHNDGVRDNNHFSNLRWATRSENQMDRVLHGTSNRGERFGRVRLTEENALAVKLSLRSGAHPRDLARQFDVAETTIKSIKQGKSWAWLDAGPVQQSHLEGK